MGFEDAPPGFVARIFRAIIRRLEGRVEIDFDGDGTLDATLFSAGDVATHTYSAPGIYLARVQVFKIGTGETWLSEIPVVVEDGNAVDSRLKAIVTGMLNRLKAGDLPGAKAAFTSNAAAQYHPALEAMAALPPSGLDGFGTLNSSFIADTFAEFVVVNTVWLRFAHHFRDIAWNSSAHTIAPTPSSVAASASRASRCCTSR